MRNSAREMSVTSQVNPEEAMEALEPFVKEGKDILHLGFSSGLSGTLNSMRLAGEMLEENILRQSYRSRYALCLHGRGSTITQSAAEKGGRQDDRRSCKVDRRK